MLTRAVNTKLDTLSYKLRTHSNPRGISFDYKGKIYSTDGTSNIHSNERSLEYTFGVCLSDLINTISLSDNSLQGGDAIRFDRTTERKVGEEISHKRKELRSKIRRRNDLEEDLRLAIFSYYGKKLGVDFEDENTTSEVKLSARNAIEHIMHSITLYHPLIGSTFYGNSISYTDLKADLYNEPEFKKFIEFKDAPGNGLIEKFFRGLHRKLALNAASPSDAAVLQRKISQQTLFYSI